MSGPDDQMAILAGMVRDGEPLIRPDADPSPAWWEQRAGTLSPEALRRMFDGMHAREIPPPPSA